MTKVSKQILWQVLLYIVVVAIAYCTITIINDYNLQNQDGHMTTDYPLSDLSKYERVNDYNSQSQLGLFYMVGERINDIYGIDGNQQIFCFRSDFTNTETLGIRDCVIVIPRGVTVELNNVYASYVAFVVEGKLQVNGSMYHNGYYYSEHYEHNLNGDIVFTNGGDIYINDYICTEFIARCYYNSTFTVGSISKLVPNWDWQSKFSLMDECTVTIDELDELQVDDVQYTLYDNADANLSSLSIDGQVVDLSPPDEGGNDIMDIVHEVYIVALLVWVIFFSINYIYMSVAIENDAKHRKVFFEGMLKTLMFWPINVAKYIKRVLLVCDNNQADKSLTKVKNSYYRALFFAGLIILLSIVYITILLVSM